MRRITIIIVLALCISSLQCDYPSPSTSVASSNSAQVTIPGTGISVGNVAPPFSVMAVTGETVDLWKLRGKVVVLAFFGTSG